jgi:hypothetical protein
MVEIQKKIPFQFEMVELIPLPWNLFMSLANQEVDSVAKKVASRMATEPTERLPLLSIPPESHLRN